MKAKIILTVGPSNSGKSDFARFYAKNGRNVYVLNRDDIRLSLFGLNTLKEYSMTLFKERLVTKIQLSMALDILEESNNLNYNSDVTIIVADTNLSKDVRKTWRSFAESHDASFKLFYDWPSLCTDGRVSRTAKIIPIEELLRRNNLRTGNAVPTDIILNQQRKFIQFLDSQ